MATPGAGVSASIHRPHRCAGSLRGGCAPSRVGSRPSDHARLCDNRLDRDRPRHDVGWPHSRPRRLEVCQTDGLDGMAAVRQGAPAVPRIRSGGSRESVSVGAIQHPPLLTTAPVRASPTCRYIAPWPDHRPPEITPGPSYQGGLVVGGPNPGLSQARRPPAVPVGSPGRDGRPNWVRFAPGSRNDEFWHVPRQRRRARRPNPLAGGAARIDKGCHIRRQTWRRR